MVAVTGPGCSQLTIEEATEAKSEHSDCSEREGVTICTSERVFGYAYSRCGFIDVAYKEDSCCELPQAAKTASSRSRAHTWGNTMLAPFNTHDCFSGSLPRAGLTELQGTASRFLQLKISTATAALQTAPEQLVQGCHARSVRADASYG